MFKQNPSFRDLFLKEAIKDNGPKVDMKESVELETIPEASIASGSNSWTAKKAGGSLVVEADAQGNLSFTVREGSDTVLFEVSAAESQRFFDWLQARPSITS